MYYEKKKLLEKFFLQCLNFFLSFYLFLYEIMCLLIMRLMCKKKKLIFFNEYCVQGHSKMVKRNLHVSDTSRFDEI